MLWNREDERRLRKLLIKEAPRSYEIFFKRKYLLPNYRQGDYVSQDLENLISFDRLATFASGAAPLKDETWKIALGNTVAGVCYGRPILFLERELGEALLRTDVLENLETGDIKWRWPAFRVYLPRRLVTIDREGETERRYATYFDVSEFGRDGTAFQCPREIAREIDTFCSRHTEFLGQIVHLRGEEPRLLERADFRYKEHAMGIGTALNKSDTIDIVQTIYAQIKPWGLISTTEYKAIGTDLEGSYPQDEADRQFVRKIEHLVLNVLLFMSSAPEAYEPHQVIRTGGLGPKAKSELMRGRFVGEMAAKMVAARPVPSSIHVAGRKLSAHWRASCWRRQHHGPRGSLIKLIWIAPYRAGQEPDGQRDKMPENPEKV